MAKFTNETFLRSEHLLEGGKFASPTWEVQSVLTDAPLMRKQKSFAGVAIKFKETDKVLGLGKTNESLMMVVAEHRAHNEWIGVKVKLEVREVKSAAGGTEPAIRIMPAAGTQMRSGLVRQLGMAWVKPINPKKESK